MRNDIKKLLQLQEKDIDLRSLKEKQKKAPEELDIEKKKVDESDSTLKQKQNDLKQAQVDRKNLELDLDTFLENVKKYEKQLLAVKTNDEYKALQKEINDSKFTAGLKEDKILEKMEEIEKLQTEVKKYEQNLQKCQGEYKVKEQEIRTYLEKLTGQINQIEKEKQELCPEIETDILERYNRIFANKADSAVVPVVNSACQGCHMKLPPSEVNEIRKNQNLVICENCARILFLPENSETSDPK